MPLDPRESGSFSLLHYQGKGCKSASDGISTIEARVAKAS